MPFLNLNNSWSNLSQYYNKPFDNKPKIPAVRYVGFDDGLIRGGVINATLASAQDTLRIGKFFASGKGVLFITKQVGLQLSNPLLEQETPQDTFGKLGDNTKSNLLNKAAGLVNRTTTALNSFINQRTPNQLYNLGLNTLTQIPLTAFGGHIIRQGKLPIGGGGYLNGSTDNIKGYNYEKITKENNRIASNRVNALTSIQSESNIPPETTDIVGKNETGKIVYNKGGKLITQYSSKKELKANLGEKSKTVGFSENNPYIQKGITVTGKATGADKYISSGNRLLSHLGAIVKFGKENRSIDLLVYNGGPESAYGIGKTFIRTYPDQQTDITQKLTDKSPSTNLNDTSPKDDASKLLNGFPAKPYSAILNKKSNIDRFNSSYIKPSPPPGTEFVGEDIEDRIGVSKTGGNKNINRSVDAINTISIMSSDTFYGFSGNGANKNIGNDSYNSANQFGDSSLFTYTKGETGKARAGNFGRDIIKFRIEFLNNNTNTNDILVFRAYINDFNDGMQAKWNSYRYIGRGEDFYIYDGFTRDISVSFTLHAHSPEEMAPLYQKLNYLMSTFTPDYNKANKMRGNIGYLTVGDYLYRQPGVFTDIKLSGMLDTHWEIALNEPEKGSDRNQYEMPKHINVSLSFKPIHNFLPRRSSTSDDGIALNRVPFITRNEADNKYLNNADKKTLPQSNEQIRKQDEADLARGMAEFERGVSMGILDRRRD
jgi:hypothetical protein